MSDKVRKEKISDARAFYIGVLLAVASVQIFLKVFTMLVPDAQSQLFSRITEGIMSVFAVFFALRTTFVQPWFGLKIEKSNVRRTVLTCILIAVGIIVLFIAARFVLQHFSEEVAKRPFFRAYLNIKHRRYYLISVLLQEILAKGVLQHGVEKNLPDDKWYIALPITALVFGMLHIYHSIYYILGAIGLALASGVLYHRQKNVWSSFVLHFLIAFLPRCFGLK